MERCGHLAAPCIIASLRGDASEEERLAFRRFYGQSRNQLEDSIASRPESLPRRQTGLPDLAGRMGSVDRRNDNVPGARVPPASRLCREAGNGEIVIDNKTEKQPGPPPQLSGRDPTPVSTVFPKSSPHGGGCLSRSRQLPTRQSPHSLRIRQLLYEGIKKRFRFLGSGGLGLCLLFDDHPQLFG